MTNIRLYVNRENSHDHDQDQTHVIGTAFVGNRKLSTDELIAKLPSVEADFVTWKTVLSEFNGFFAIIKCSQGNAVLVTDRLRSIPIFYGQKGRSILVSNDAEWLRRELNNKVIDPISRKEFLLTGYVTGSDTLFSDLKQVRAGELLRIISRKQPTTSNFRWYDFRHHESGTSDETELQQKLDKIAEDSVRRLVSYANGRQIVLPLSGGYDSRLIALLLKRIGYKNILAFTYGVPGNKESLFSSKVAHALNLDWKFIEYNEEKWRAAWESGELSCYLQRGSGCTSLPHIQDWLAVWELRRKKAICDDAIFAPGHTGDFISGSHIPKDFFKEKQLDSQELEDALFRAHYSLVPYSRLREQDRRFWKSRILRAYEQTALNGNVALADIFENWEWQERQAKYIVNSVRVYDFFCYDWWLPFWDAGFMSFWEGVPLKSRKGSLLYIEYVKRIFELETGQKALENASNTINSKIKRIVPRTFIRFVRRFIPDKKIGSGMSGIYPKAISEASRRMDFVFLGTVAQEFLRDYEASLKSDT